MKKPKTAKTQPLEQSKPASIASSKPATPAKAAIDRSTPARFTYALKAYTAERRADGWWICRTTFASAGEKPEWSGPFATIETAVLAIARRLATEIADRHTRSVEGHQLKDSDPLYGLKATTRLDPKTGSSSL